MANWYQDWFGPQPEGGAGGRLPALTGITFAMPVHTRVIEVLTEELPDVEVFPDVDQGTGRNDSIVVQNVGGEWSVATTSWQQRARDIRIFVFSATSNGAEVLLDKVATIIKRRRADFRLVSVADTAGGYDEANEIYYRGIQATFKGRK